MYKEGGEKIHLLRCSRKLNNYVLSAASSDLDLLIGPFGCTNILVSSDLVILRPSDNMYI